MSVGQATREGRLASYLHAVRSGKRKVSATKDAKQFLEAISVQPDPDECVERVVGSTDGLEAIKKSVRFDMSLSFLNGTIAPFLLYIAHPSVKLLCNGQHLHRILAAIADPPTLVNELIRLLESHLLSDDCVHAIAWLMWELVNLPDIFPTDPIIMKHARSVTEQKLLLDADLAPARHLGQQLKEFVRLRDVKPSYDPAFEPGGRHDNDFADFRSVSIRPTGDEMACSRRAFYRRSDDILSHPDADRPAMHLDNQFRLLREDMLGELRLDVQAAQGKLKMKRHITVIDDLALCGIHFGDETKRFRSLSSLKFECTNDIARLKQYKTKKDRRKYLQDQHSFLRNESFGVLLHGQASEVLAFATIDRDEDLLSQSPPVVVLRMADPLSIKKTLITSKQLAPASLKFVQLDTPLFAYEPILKRLQDKSEFPMAAELLSDSSSQTIRPSVLGIDVKAKELISSNGQRVDKILGLTKPVNLDASQDKSLVAGLTQSLSLIQGPPGTGKSFIGALLAKAIHDYTNEKILVMCYTNHALDQFLEDLLDNGIPEQSIVRLGSKSTLRTSGLAIRNQQTLRHLKASDWGVIDQHKEVLEDTKTALNKSLGQFLKFGVSHIDILCWLEFSEDYYRYFDALKIEIESDDDMEVVGRYGKKLQPDYLIKRWVEGKDAGIFADSIQAEHLEIWKLAKSSRWGLLRKWQLAILEEQAASIPDRIQTYNERIKLYRDVFQQGESQLLQSKRIIGCTTTGASMFVSQLETTRPGVLIVEEAGEILESHILAAMSLYTKQLILIGDHKQLRPKINNYGLTVEQGDGFDLNRSLFERLVLNNYPHQTLQNQHRMPPQISSIIKHLTYPDLADSPTVLSRPRLKGLQDRVVLVNHDKPEAELDLVADRRDQGAKSSKQNDHEVTLVMCTLKYLAQQGYGTSKVAVLTPYLGQLFLLKSRLSKDNDPVLNDMDSSDLVRAGLMAPAKHNGTKKSIRLSTIDNYQGEECEIIIISLTRSNDRGDIGFLSSPQRLNVLLSRSRLGLIIIGNVATFQKSKKGAGTWTPFLDYMKKNGYIYDGLPAQCERHLDRKVLLRDKDDFERLCPDGGCAEPCGATISCGAHQCESKCHQIVDHSKMPCHKIVDFVCPKGHKAKIKCNDKAAYSCRECEQEAREQKRRLQRDYELDQRRAEKQRIHAQKLALIQTEIDHLKRVKQDRQDEINMQNALRNRQQDLDTMKLNMNIQGAVNAPTSTLEQSVPNTAIHTGSKNKPDVGRNDKPTPKPPSPQSSDSTLPQPKASKEWRRRKNFEGESNEALDELVNMVGLEKVKEKFLEIKDKVDTYVRQSVDLTDERFSATLLGNPGTGKTTVARLYAKFLTSVGALAGDTIRECTGSGLASQGIPGCKQAIDEILNSGGGALFIDEAYQLASGDNPSGKSVLDYLLAEVENLRGKVVFILAGYSKQMEKFFEHNQGFPSRFPLRMDFEDYEDDELLQLINFRLTKKYKGRMQLEGGPMGLFARIISRRIGRGRGREGFGNARAVENCVSRIIDAQTKRISLERRQGKKTDDLFLTSADLMGSRPSNVLKANKTWQQLQEMIGLEAVKTSLSALFDSIEHNYQRELDEKPLVEFNLNRVFLGNPGTGKTTVAKLYGQILADMGLLSNGEVIVKTPSDFIGNVLGASESQTKAILASAVGKVLVIDEAYGLYEPDRGSGNIFKSAVIDIIVGEVQSTAGQDRCVLLLGYQKQMEEMFQGANPGLARRFPLASAFNFEDFTKDQLRDILELKLKQQGFSVTGQTKSVALDVLERSRNRPNFGNAGEVDNLLNHAKLQYQKRLSKSKLKHEDVFQPEDFDEEHDRSSRADTRVSDLFADVIGCDDIVEQLEGYQRTVANMKARGMDPKEQIPFSFLFKGPPGTGKTSTARKMGKVYYDMGFLATAKVEECSATDLVGQYVGHTGPKTRKLFEKALGRVLFIDEAYRLGEGKFSEEAMDEVVDCLTKPEFHKKLIVILAGYTEDIDRLMSKNPGLTSRFPDTVTFRNLEPEDCFKILLNLLEKRKQHVNISVMENAQVQFYNAVCKKFWSLSRTANWANARDVQTVGKAVFGRLISSAASSSSEKLALTQDIVLEEMDKMISERSKRAAASQMRNGLANLHLDDAPSESMSSGPMQPPPVRATNSASNTIATASNPISALADNAEQPATAPESDADQAPLELSTDTRDAGVDDPTWLTLQQDTAIAGQKKKDYQALLAQDHKLATEISNLTDKVTQTSRDDVLASPNGRNSMLSHETDRAQAKSREDDEEKNKEADEERRQAEQERIRLELERRALEEEQERIREARRKMEEERRQEQAAQRKLRAMGVCPMGYRWIKQAAGYRCAGGSHVVSNEQIERG